MLVACGRDDDDAGAEEAVTNLCDSLDDLGAVVDEYEALDPDTATLGDVRAVNEQVEIAFNDVANAAQEFPGLDLVPLDSSRDHLVRVADDSDDDSARTIVIGSASRSLAVAFEIEDLKSENC